MARARGRAQYRARDCYEYRASEQPRVLSSSGECHESSPDKLPVMG